MEEHEKVLDLAENLKNKMVELDFILKTYYTIYYPDLKDDFYTDAVLCTDSAIDLSKELQSILQSYDLYLLPKDKPNSLFN